jgi:hypothetical protein
MGRRAGHRCAAGQERKAVQAIAQLGAPTPGVRPDRPASSPTWRHSAAMRVRVPSLSLDHQTLREGCFVPIEQKRSFLGPVIYPVECRPAYICPHAECRLNRRKRHAIHIHDR